MEIKEFNSMNVVSYHYEGTAPEYHAWSYLFNWIIQNNYSLDGCRFFGFNNPNPEHGIEEVGFEVWMTTSQGTETDGLVKYKEITQSGLYAVHKITLKNIENGWGQLIDWLNNSEYEYDNTRQYLEEHYINNEQLKSVLTNNKFEEDELVIDLCLPIINK